MSTTRDTRPQALDEFIGQENAKRQIETAVVMAEHLSQPLPPMLLTGGSGNGKTTLARLTASRMGQEFESLIWPPSTQDSLARQLVNSSNSVLLLDEIHRGTRANSEWLHEALDPENPVAQYGSGYKVPLENVSFIAATTDVHKLDNALRRRFLLELELKPYSDDQITTIIEGMLVRSGVTLDEGDAQKLALACNGKPGMAERLVNAALGLTIQYGNTEADAILEHLEMDIDGLMRRHRLYLVVMARISHLSSQGSVGLDTMSQALELPTPAVEEIEGLLTKTGLIVAGGKQGRILTKTGDARAKIIQSEGSI